jgi:hypothetical protein
VTGTSPHSDSEPRENTFDTVDGKVAEAEFFLRQMAEAGMDMFAFSCYLSAYLAAARTATLALQRFSHVSGFAAWYEPHQARLKTDALAKFILAVRNDHLHGGPSPLAGGSFQGGEAEYRFARVVGAGQVPPHDILTACRDHLIVLLEIVLDSYVQLGVHIDPQQHYTKEHFASLGRTIDDAEVEVWGWIRESLIDEGLDEDERWHELRGHVAECKINRLFYSYLGRTTPQPKEPEHFADFDYSPEEKGWTTIPAGFKSREDYCREYPSRRPRDD